METPNKLDVKRRSNGTFEKGQVANPNGRPKGKTLKEFAREFLMNMTDAEKSAWLKGLSPEIVWRMAEGNPHQTQDMTTAGEKLESVLVKFIDGKDHTDTDGVS
jgi:hypothetical protein